MEDRNWFVWREELSAITSSVDQRLFAEQLNNAQVDISPNDSNVTESNLTLLIKLQITKRLSLKELVF